jgi:dynein heavy chain, axonemal
MGGSILIEKTGETIDQVFEPVVKRQLIKTGTNKYNIKLADKEIEYDFNFKLYITTQLPKRKKFLKIYFKTEKI